MRCPDNPQLAIDGAKQGKRECVLVGLVAQSLPVAGGGVQSQHNVLPLMLVWGKEKDTLAQHIVSELTPVIEKLQRDGILVGGVRVDVEFHMTGVHHFMCPRTHS
jgi:hypothetical protein